jgi:hypothetical protein
VYQCWCCGGLSDGVSDGVSDDENLCGSDDAYGCSGADVDR